MKFTFKLISDLHADDAMVDVQPINDDGSDDDGARPVMNANRICGPIGTRGIAEWSETVGEFVITNLLAN